MNFQAYKSIVWSNFLKQEGRKGRCKFFGISLALFMAFISYSCTDKDLDIDINDKETEINLDEDEISLSFPLSVGMDFTTRDGEDYEKYDNDIDTDKMIIMFFDNSGDFLFEVGKDYRDITESPDKNGQWDVLIHLTKVLKDYNGITVPLSLIKAQLEKEDFRIAVLANWDGYGDTDYKLPWGWENSKLNTQRQTGKLRNVNHLHHLENNSAYEKASGAYGFLAENGKINLGVRTNWVNSTLDYPTSDNRRADAEQYIRDYWNPSGNIDTSNKIGKFLKDNYYFEQNSTTSNLWQVWNFGGSYENNAFPYDNFTREEKNFNKPMPNDWADEWQEKNGDALKSWLDGATNGVLTSTDEKTGIDGFYFVQSEKTGGVKSTVVNEVIDEKGYHGIALGQTDDFETTKNENGNEIAWRLNLSQTDKIKGYIHFTAYESGILRFLYRCEDVDANNKGAKLIIQRNSNYEANTGNFNFTEIKQYYKKIDITGNPEEIYIFNINNNAKAIIYGIEYISDDYVYSTDRQAVVPSESRRIPMYGIQKYPNIDEWGSVKVLDLSATGKHIELIRSIAKVEVYFPASTEVKKVFMRSMNRRSHGEPMDVLNPSIDNWTKSTGRNVHDATHCEWFDIKNYSYLYGKNDVSDYQTWFKWFYDTWDGINGPSNPDYHPHVFNPSIDRSDFCEFYYAGEVNGMKKYVVYMPDKNIDDPNDDGVINSTPKIAHIEYRYQRHSDYWDDNQCHRIYFTDYKENPDFMSIDGNDFDDKEKDSEFLSKLWPVMRNHIYRFYINSNNKTEEVRVSVNDWISDTEPKKETW
ncbi:MAG: hypothetical protein J1F12_08835 [Muribaculaceae bacterium]|nr:hypothetical protein [Muribaculaceae bacterium]